MLHELYEWDPNLQEAQIARDTLERYSGSEVTAFQPYLLLTNFPKYVQYFSDFCSVPILEGSMFKVAHAPQYKISILDFKIGSPAAALVIDLLAHLPIKAALLLGMCGGLRKHYKVGDYFVPVASIRGEGTSDFYFPAEVPALANFLVQKEVTNVLDLDESIYHIGICHTTNKRFWEFNKEFKHRLETTRPQAIEMESATLFMASYRYKLPLGALLLISDLPLGHEGIKTKISSNLVYTNYTADHVEKGIRIIQSLDNSIHKQAKGVFRGKRQHFQEPLI